MSCKNPSLRMEDLKASLGIYIKAAPRFELGIKDLQSSALPLGHAAAREQLSPSEDRILSLIHI